MTIAWNSQFNTQTTQLCMKYTYASVYVKSSFLNSINDYGNINQYSDPFCSQRSWAFTENILLVDQTDTKAHLWAGWVSEGPTLFWLDLIMYDGLVNFDPLLERCLSYFETVSPMLYTSYLCIWYTPRLLGQVGTPTAVFSLFLKEMGASTWDVPTVMDNSTGTKCLKRKPSRTNILSNNNCMICTGQTKKCVEVNLSFICRTSSFCSSRNYFLLRPLLQMLWT